MAGKHSTLTPERLRELLDYDPATGVFTRKTITGAGRRIGQIAGTVNLEGRSQICIDYTHYLAHRLAWLYVHGKWPQHQIDHIDGNPLNNAIANLRDVTPSVNQQNQRKPPSSNTTGFLGVHWSSSKSKPYCAHIKWAGTMFHLGVFTTAEEAHEAYLSAKRKMHKGCTI